jgi:hypothetical protein
MLEPHIHLWRGTSRRTGLGPALSSPRRPGSGTRRGRRLRRPHPWSRTLRLLPGRRGGRR